METNSQEKLVLCFVGLPARGKSYQSRKLAKFLTWLGYSTRIFSVGFYRRSLLGPNLDNKHFDEENENAFSLREKVAKIAVKEMVDFLEQGGQIGIIDGTNINSSKRRRMEQYVSEEMKTTKYSLVWIESICTLESVIERNIMKAKLKSMDYKDWDPEKAIQDLRERIKHYEKVYEHLSFKFDGGATRFIQLTNHGKEIKMRNIQGYIHSKILSFMINLKPCDYPIYFSRHGESMSNTKNVVGGDSLLSDKGVKYSHQLYNFIKKECETLNCEKFVVYTSSLKRTIQTAEPFANMGKHKVCKYLDELNVGAYDGLSYEDIKARHPKEFEDREKDKLNYRYPMGESYKDLINRIEPIIYELERRSNPVLVIGHQASLRCLYGYFVLAPLKKIPHLDVPLNCVIKLSPEGYLYSEDRYSFDLESGNTTSQQFNKRFEDNLTNIPSTKDISNV